MKVMTNLTMFSPKFPNQARFWTKLTNYSPRYQARFCLSNLEASKRSSQDRDSSGGLALPDWLFDNCEASAAKRGSVGEAPAVNTSSTPARFGPVVSEADVQGAQQKAIPANTKKGTTWAVNVWKEWSEYRRRTCESHLDAPPHLFLCRRREVNNWLSRFVLEVRRKDGSLYPPNTLYQLCCGGLRYVREIKPELDIFRHTVVASFRKTLDAETSKESMYGVLISSMMPTNSFAS